MKLALIDYLLEDTQENIRLELKPLLDRGVEIDMERNLHAFEEHFGSVANYDGLMAHPGVKNQREYLMKIPVRYPDLKFAVITWADANFDASHESVLTYKNPGKIFDYFSS